ncbi:MAG: phage holin, LLH family [Anaerorhabdus sp.]|uniref:phage holin, LLH family n=1 Tax=Anaerorhabdus sp. TaxID=1872524 RepID=UPI002FC9F3AB
MLQNIADTIAIVILLAPVVIKLVNLIATKTHSQRLQNLAKRADLIVAGLEQSGLSNEEKKLEALNKLSKYSKEVGIPVTPDQLDDYIESAVKFLKMLAS